MRIQIDFRDNRASIETKATTYEVNHGCLIIEHKEKGAIGYFPLDCIEGFLVYKNDNEGGINEIQDTYIRSEIIYYLHKFFAGICHRLADKYMRLASEIDNTDEN